MKILEANEGLFLMDKALHLPFILCLLKSISAEPPVKSMLSAIHKKNMLSFIKISRTNKSD